MPGRKKLHARVLSPRCHRNVMLDASSPAEDAALGLRPLPVVEMYKCGPCWLLHLSSHC